MDFNLSQLSNVVWISNLSKPPGLSILAVDGFEKLVLLHNVSYLQENIFCDEAKLWVFVGMTIRLRCTALIRNLPLL